MNNLTREAFEMDYPEDAELTDEDYIAWADDLVIPYADEHDEYPEQEEYEWV